MKPRGSKKATQFTESVIREMTRLAQEHDAVNLSQGFPDFAAHQVDQGRGVPGHPARHQSVPDHVGRGEPARGDCRRFLAALRRRREPDAGDRLLRLDRGDALDAAGRARSRRRGRHLRAVLRELRPRQHHLRRGSAFRAAARARLDVRRAGARRRVQRPDARHHHQHAEQPDGEGVHAGTSCSSSRGCARSGTCSRLPTRSTSTSSTTATRTCRSRRSTAWPIAR